MKKIAVIFAGGVGSRMGSDIPKQFLEIYGKPIIIHTLEKFQYDENIDEIYIGCKEEYISYLGSLIIKYNLNKIKLENILAGGKSGLDTIYNILMAVKSNNDNAIVLIHDGVRPNINSDIIEKNIISVINKGNSITCVPAFETPVISDKSGLVDEVLDRKKVFMAKAPQSFMLNDILDAYNKVLNDFKDFSECGFVDSCSIALYSGLKLNIVEGNRDNIKVTTPEDYIDILGRLISEDYTNFLNIKTKKAVK